MAEKRVAYIKDLIDVLVYLEGDDDLEERVEALEEDVALITNDVDANREDIELLFTETESIETELLDHKNNDLIHRPVTYSSDETESPPSGGFVLYYNE